MCEQVTDFSFSL